MLPRLQRRSTAMSAILILSFLGFLACLLFRGATALPWVLAALSFFSLALALLTARMLGNRPGFSANNRPSFLLLLEPLAALMLAAAAVLRFLSLTGFSPLVYRFRRPRRCCLYGHFLPAAHPGPPTLSAPLYGTYPGSHFADHPGVPLLERRSPHPRLLLSSVRHALRSLREPSPHWVLPGSGKAPCQRIFLHGRDLFLRSGSAGSLADVLTYLGYLLFLSATLWSLLAPSRRKQPRPIRAEES